MRTKKILQWSAVPLVAFLALGANCPLIPEIEERIVELALLGSTAVEFTSQGEINTIDEVRVIDIRDDFDLDGLLDDAGVDVSEVKAIKVAGVSYRTTQAEVGTARTIMNGNVTIQRAGGPVVPLVTNFSEFVNEVLSYKTAPLDPAGVDVINDIAADLLKELQDGTPANSTVTYHLTGDSTPINEETDFKWEVKVDVSVVGTIKVDVVN